MTSCEVEALALPREQRSRMLTAARLARTGDVLAAKGRCGSCALVLEYCICQELEQLRSRTSEAAQAAEIMRFAVWMHASERGRASNSGKLLAAVLPEASCEIFFHDVPGELERLQESMRAVEGRAYVLYPSADAVSVSAAFVQGTADSKADPPSKPALVVLIDGTWRQAKKMHRELGSLPRLALSETPGHTLVSQIGWRRQSEEGRVTTSEAAAALLQELMQEGMGACGGASGGNDFELWVHALTRAGALLQDALERQSHYRKEALPPKQPAHKRERERPSADTCEPQLEARPSPARTHE